MEFPFFSTRRVTMLLLLLLVVAVASLAPAAESVTCNPTELTPCAGAIFGSAPPSQACCGKLREQRPCLCQYARNPSLSPFVNTPRARQVAATCGVPFPRC